MQSIVSCATVLSFSTTDQASALVELDERVWQLAVESDDEKIIRQARYWGMLFILDLGGGG